MAGTGRWTPSVAGCTWVRSWRLERLADAGTWLAATWTTWYSLTTAEASDTEYELASVPRKGRTAGFGRPNFPSQKRHHCVSLRPSDARMEHPRPGKRLVAMRIMRRNSRTLRSTGAMQTEDNL